MMLIGTRAGDVPWEAVEFDACRSKRLFQDLFNPEQALATGIVPHSVCLALSDNRPFLQDEFDRAAGSL